MHPPWTDYGLIFGFQIFEDGATYRGRMKTLARQVVSFHYKAKLDPIIEHCHNLDQRDEAISRNVRQLIEESLFLQGPPDANASFSPRDDQPH